MSARARKKATKKKTPKKAVRKKTAKKKVVRKTATKKKTTKKTAKKKKATKKPAVKKAAKPGSSKKDTSKRIAKKRPLTAEEKRARAQQRAAERKFLRESRARLLSRRSALVEAYHSAKGHTKASTAGGTEDYIDYAVSSYDRDFSLSLTELERMQLLLVEEALGRIRRREYGRCLNCGVVIPRRRLEVEAWARYCLPCQELDDQGLLEATVFETESDDEATPSDDEGGEDDKVLRDEEEDEDD